jgi:hypothetical protein
MGEPRARESQRREPLGQEQGDQEGARSFGPCFSQAAPALTAAPNPWRRGEDRGTCLPTPRGMEGAVRAGGLGKQTRAGLCQRAGAVRRTTRTRALHTSRRPWLGTALDPRAEGGRGYGERVRNGLEARPWDHRAHGWGTAAAARRLGLWHAGVQRGQSGIGQGPCEGPHAEGLPNTGRQKDQSARPITYLPS